MASYLDKAQVNTALTDNTKLDLGHQHITTGDFFQLNPSYIHEMVPGSKIDVKLESFARLNPLPVPTFGRASMRTRAFFVPFRTIFRGWNDFITDSVHIFSDGQSSSAIQSFVPRVSNLVLMNTFASSIATGNDASASCTAMLYAVTGAVYDVAISGVTYNFTVLGRQAIKILESLGYKINWDSKDDTNYSALPLLALSKVYADWYYPAQYHDLNGYDYLLHLCNYDMQTDLQLTSADVKVILQNCAWVQYDSDYFVSAWDTPNQPNIGNHSDFKLVNIDTMGSYYGTGSNTIVASGAVSNKSDTPTVSDNMYDKFGGMDAPFLLPQQFTGLGTNVGTGISQYMLHSLHALTDYMKRHQLAGSRKPNVRLIIEI